GFGMDVVTPLPPPPLCSQNETYVEESNLEIGEEWEGFIGDLSAKDYSSNFFSTILGALWSTVTGIASIFTQFLPAFAGKYSFNLLSPTFSPFIHAAYFYLIKQIVTHVQFAVFVLLTFVLEIIITVTAFRSVSGFLGGEMEILGLTKVV
ncbi:MAG TPA: hypothetical protein PKJ97_03120, partial [Candidatus Bilamarchaeaceae archaeon]|nr:hypothetical protein [Candidatus Bilamarchaeaceae archaeon]